MFIENSIWVWLLGWWFTFTKRGLGASEPHIAVKVDQVHMLMLPRSIELLAVAFRATKKRDESTRTLVQGFIRLTNRNGFMLNFRWQG